MYKRFLSSLATKKKLAASSLNQAFNALLFLFSHVLEKPIEKVEGVVRAKKKPFILKGRKRDSQEDLRHILCRRFCYWAPLKIVFLSDYGVAALSAMRNFSITRGTF